MIGFDCNTKLTPETAKAFKADGYEFVMRYVGRLVQKPHDLNKCEADLIRAAGLKLGIVQHVWGAAKPKVNKALGVTYGKNAAAFAKQCGYAAGCVVYLDLEDVPLKTAPESIIEYCNAWFDQVKAAGYQPGIYIGFNTFLTGEQLYKRLKFETYWKSMSRVPDVYRRGYAMIQDNQIKKHGILIDPDELQPDRLGDLPRLME